MNEQEELTIEKLKEMLNKKFSSIDYQNAKEDVIAFIKDKRKIDLWSKEFFIDITNNLRSDYEK
ncbi:MAG: hypothetical protein ACOX02_00275 [Acholeplasmatales bacterium]